MKHSQSLWQRAVPATGLLAAFVLVLLAMAVRPVYAATINVDNGVVAYADDGQCSLPEAITNAGLNAQQFASPGECAAGAVGADTIVLPVDGLFTLTEAFVNFGGNTGLPLVGSEIIIEGNGSTIERSGAAGAFRILAISNAGNLTINDTTIRNGRVLAGGAVINDSGTLTLNGSTLTGNSTTTGGGGAIYGIGTVNITNSTLSGNTANESGGAISSSGGTVTIVNSTFTGNSAVVGNGGAITVVAGTINLINSVVSGNSAFNGSEITRLGGTFNANASNVFGHSGKTNAQAFIGFTPGANDLTATSDGTNPTALAAILNTTLADNGGPTPTHALTANSPAIDFAPTAVCAAAPVNGFDQRDEPRNVNILGVGSGTTNLCDAGAYEYQPTRLTIVKETNPDGGTGFIFTVDPAVYDYDFQWGSVGTTEGEFNIPGSVARDAAGNIYVADVSNARIQKFNSSGTFLLMWGWGVTDGSAALQTCTSGCQPGIVGGSDGQFYDPLAVAVDVFGHVYVADEDNQRIQKFDSSGAFLDKWGSAGTAEGQFATVRGVATDATGNVYVSDSFNQRIQKFDSNGNFIVMWGWGVDDGTAVLQTCTSGCEAGIGGPGAGQLTAPAGLATAANGDVYIADSARNRITKFSATGAYLTQWGDFGTAEGQFTFPYSVTVDTAGNVYVSDSFSHRMQKFDSDGNFILTWGWGVTDGSMALQTCTSACTFGEPGSGNGQLENPRGAVVDQFGRVYVADLLNNRIQVFEPSQTVLLNDGQSDTGVLEPGDYLVSELVPAGWVLDDIACDGGSPDYGDLTVGLSLSAGDDVTCTFTNNLCQPGFYAAGNACVPAPAGSFVDMAGASHPSLCPPGRFQAATGQTSCEQADPGFFVPEPGATEQIPCPAGTTSGAGATECTEIPVVSYCPVDDEAVGYAMTDLLGTGQGSKTKGFRTRKLVIPNSDEVVALYGQLAAIETGVMKYVRFLPQGEPKVQIAAPTSAAYRTYAIDWWGSDLPTDANWVKGQFFWGAKANKSPRAFVLWPTYETDEQYANAWVLFDNSSENHVAWEPGFIQSQTQVIEIPETQADGATVVVRVAIVDNDKDARPVRLDVTVGSDTQGNSDTVPNMKDTLNLYELTFTDVDAGIDEVTIRLTSPLPGDGAPAGDSAAMIGAAVSYACGIESVPGPLAEDDAYEFPFYAAVDHPAASGLFADNGSGPDDLDVPAATLVSFGGGSLGGSASSNAAGSTVALAGGSLTVNADGSWSLQGTPFFTGVYTFDYVIQNTNGQSTATVTLTIPEGGG